MKVEYVKIKRWYLEMNEYPMKTQRPVQAGISVRKFGKLSCGEYRNLNKVAGEGVMWVDRQIMRDEDLLAIIHDPAVEMFGLYDYDELAGFAEIGKKDNEYELHYFG